MANALRKTENVRRVPDITPKERQRIEDAIEKLLALLDVLDGDDDLEDDGTGVEDSDPGEEGGDLEPSLGAPEQRNPDSSQELWSRGGELGTVDLEMDDDFEPDFVMDGA